MIKLNRANRYYCFFFNKVYLIYSIIKSHFYYGKVGKFLKLSKKIIHNYITYRWLLLVFWWQFLNVFIHLPFVSSMMLFCTWNFEFCFTSKQFIMYIFLDNHEQFVNRNFIYHTTIRTFHNLLTISLLDIFLYASFCHYK